MRNTILIAILAAMLASPASAANYPVTGRWGQGDSAAKPPIDCSKLRVIEFNGDTRTDSDGGVPGYRLKSISSEGPSAHRIVDQFTSGQIRNGSTRYTLRQIDADHIELNMQQGGTIKLQRCK